MAAKARVRDTDDDGETTVGGRLLGSVITMGAFVAILWAVEIVDQLIFSGRLDAWGVRPRELRGLWGILAAPFLHGSFVHLIANTPPLFVLGLLVRLRGVGPFLGITSVVIVVGGFGTWLTGGSNSVHIGASGLVFGYFGFLLLAGFIERGILALITSIGVAFLYGGLIWGVLPQSPHISWQGHLFGFLGGLAVAWGGRKASAERRRGALPPHVD